MTNPFEMRFQYCKGTIANRLNKQNRRSKRAVSNSGVTETILKFDGPQRRSAAQSIYKKKPRRYGEYAATYGMGHFSKTELNLTQFYKNPNFLLALWKDLAELFQKQFEV